MSVNRPIIPPALKKGSTIGIIAPAGKILDINRFTEGVRILHQLGYQTKFPRDLWPGSGYLAADDSARAQELQRCWHDNEVDGIMVARGGYGSLRIAKPFGECHLTCTDKLFIGFSDATLLHMICNNIHGVATLHGPVVTSLQQLDKTGIEYFATTLAEGIFTWKHDARVDILRGAGVLSGLSTGGNLTTIVSTIGTCYEPDWQDRIVFLEDTSESLYRIDRMVTQLKLCGKLDTAAAFVLGDFSAGLGLDLNGKIRLHETVWHRFLELTASTIPVWGNFPIGHGTENIVVPMGVELVMDNSTCLLRTQPVSE